MSNKIQVQEGDSPSNIKDSSFMREVETGDDAGVVIEGGQLSVGAKGAGQETVLGEGDSYPVEYAFHCDEADTSGTTITNATDITTILQSDNGSTTGLLGGTSVGKYILVGSQTDSFAGVKVKIDTCGLVEPQNLIGQFLRGDLVWNDSTFMAFSEGDQLTQYGWNICNASDSSEQWNFGFDPTNLPTPWPKTTLNINGTDIEAYWGRFMIINGAITSDPIVEQLKLHTNRMEFNANGIQIRYGEARRRTSLISGLHNIIKNSLADPGDETVTYATGVARAYEDNQFADNATDGFTFQQNINVGLDTSVPLLVDVWYYVKGTATGDIEFELDIVNYSEGFVHDGTEAKVSYQKVETISVSSNLVAKKVRFVIPINYFSVNSKAIFNLYRDATAGNTDDTLAAPVIITDLDVIGYEYF